MQNSIFTLKKQLFTLCILPVIFCFISCLEPHVSYKYYSLDGREEYGVQKAVGVKTNLTLAYRNYGGDRLYKRIWQQLGTKETVEALKTEITIDMSKVEGMANSDDGEIWYAGEGANLRNTRARVGLIFDLHETKVKEYLDDYGKLIKMKYYDFVFIGYRPSTKSFYVEKYIDVPQNAFEAETNYSSISDQEGVSVEFLASTTGATTSWSKFYIDGDEVDTSLIDEYYGKLGYDDNGNYYGDKAVALQRFTITITQDIPGTYVIRLLGQEFYYTPEVPYDEKLIKLWYSKDGYRRGGAGYCINVPVDTDVTVNFNSKNDITRGL